MDYLNRAMTFALDKLPYRVQEMVFGRYNVGRVRRVDDKMVSVNKFRPDRKAQLAGRTSVIQQGAQTAGYNNLPFTVTVRAVEIGRDYSGGISLPDGTEDIDIIEFPDRSQEIRYRNAGYPFRNQFRTPHNRLELTDLVA